MTRVDVVLVYSLQFFLNKFRSFAVKIDKYMLIQVSPGGITVKLPVSLTTLHRSSLDHILDLRNTPRDLILPVLHSAV